MESELCVSELLFVRKGDLFYTIRREWLASGCYHIKDFSIELFWFACGARRACF
jgi:hypothetical protein